MLKISSDSLNELKLQSCMNVILLEIDAPNLRLFYLTVNMLVNTQSPLISLIHPTKCETTLCFSCIDLSWWEDRCSYLTIKNFISHTNQFRQLHVIIEKYEGLFGGEEVQELGGEPGPEIKHLELQPILQLVNYGNIFDGLLWCCHPPTTAMPLGPEK